MELTPGISIEKPEHGTHTQWYTRGNEALPRMDEWVTPLEQINGKRKKLEYRGL